MMNETNRKTRVIGNWQPSLLIYDVIEQEFESIINKLLPTFSLSNLEIRTPELHIKYQHDYKGKIGFNTDPYIYHQDGLTDFEAVMWSNVLPTSIKFEDDGTLLRAKHGDIILINNLEVKHRAPVIGNKTNRWFIRAN